MTESRRPGSGPSLLLAVGVIASTIVAWLLSHSSWLALVGSVGVLPWVSAFSCAKPVVDVTLIVKPAAP